MARTTTTRTRTTRTRTAGTAGITPARAVRTIRASAQKALEAGMQAATGVRQTASGAFDALVKQGAALEARSRRAAIARAGKARDAACARAEEARDEDRRGRLPPREGLRAARLQGHLQARRADHEGRDARSRARWPSCRRASSG